MRRPDSTIAAETVMPPTQYQTTLTQFLNEERRRYPGPSGDFNSLSLPVALACKSIARAIALGALGGMLEHADGSAQRDGRPQMALEVLSNEASMLMAGTASAAPAHFTHFRLARGGRAPRALSQAAADDQPAQFAV
jgi:hypothetical protein